MATRTINTKIQLDGEREFKSAIADINSGLGVLNSEMRKVTAQYQDNSKSVEALKAKNDVLDRTLVTQKEKVEELRQALQNSAEKYGEADKRTMKWQKSLNDAETAVYNTEAAIRENNKALDEAQGGGNKLSPVLDSLADKFGNQLPGGVKNALTSIGGFSTGAVIAVGAVAAAVAALIATYTKLIDLTKEVSADADNILTLSQVTGLDTESIQEMQYASELIDVSFDTIQGSMRKMKKSLDDVRDGTGDVADAYKKLGVTVTDEDGNFRDSEDIFYDLIDALGEVGNETERDNLSMQVFGKSAEELNPLIKQGTTTLKAYAEEAHNASYILGEEQLAALGAVDDAYQRLQNTQEASKKQIAAELAPAVEEFYTAWGEFIQNVAKALVESGILDNLSNMLRYFSQMITSMDDAEGKVPSLVKAFETLGTVLRFIAQMAASVVDLFNAIVNFNLYGIISGKFGDALGLHYGSGTANEAQKVRLMWEGNYDQYMDYYGNNASGDQNWRGGLTWVGESGPELVSLPQGSSIYSAQESREMSGDTYNITIDASNVKEFNDIIRMAKNSRVTARMRG